MATQPQTLQRPPARTGRPAPTQGNFFTQKYGPLPGWAWALVAAGGFFIIYEWRKKKAASTTSATSTTTATGGVPYITAAPVGGATPGGGGGGYSGGGGSSGGGTGSTPNTPPGGVQAPAPSGPQTITIGGTQYDVLGQVGPTGKRNELYTVTGGAPVFYGNVNTIKQGTVNDKPGNYVYTPATYQNLTYKTGTAPPGS